ncbi:uncharacterized protein BDCG_05031 [Blastomyces dermatitidis ER-3]|uniref:Uncharacterized protein n=3 Tax=Blastomyces TaxID=229219 RepID=A0A179V0S8_BLAGS|nr:uncharacterized protein BDBG_08342 [Blastomyces gilchristii SLH14081]XP_045276742.1 uncharacterized protein BDCG_05031 [Blastomyces dermatitidis ER-3]EGE80955.1 hypothetical protein BDDG_03896 [Blastomyces dermatitidis ATCC 18188]EQL37820.1 hypothetical protein BDFG_00863 [Blastomyces dermatitidis ATCC 26199]EEQ89911.2 hypothetical protein BDCG_05031 [Blastomyces dermatitidis ER-3]OAT13069.1 hypothetical protein BDBG_08342 [Blastomyces gilchristii SLH14081]
MQPALLLLLSLAALSNAIAVPGSDGTCARKVDARYACMTDSDCVMVKHGNCCGATDVCALAHAKFTKDEICPAGSGGVGVCGFESIDGCACRDGACYGLRGGKVTSSPKEWGV